MTKLTAAITQMASENDWAKNCDKASSAGMSCVTKICNDQPSCCSGTWDQSCVDKVNTVCNLGCSL